MRNFLAKFLALLTVVLLPAGAWAGTHTLNGTYNSGQIDMACVDAQGWVTKGKGPGGYGCKTKKGEVSCTAAGKCTGTCKRCGKRLVRSGKRDLTAVLTSPVGARK